LLLDRDFETVVSTVERALSFNLSCATALQLGALIHALAGHPVEVVAHAKRALRLSPFDVLAYQAHAALAVAAVHEARYDDAVLHATRQVQANPSLSSNHFGLPITLALAGRLDDGRLAARRGLELEPGFQMRMFRQVLAFGGRRR
jgi:adenylate cyclase